MLRYQTLQMPQQRGNHEKQQLQQQIAQVISNTALAGVIFAVLLMVFINLYLIAITPVLVFGQHCFVHCTGYVRLTFSIYGHNTAYLPVFLV